MATVTASTNVTTGADSADRPKHRACDECRVRKLACTKEPDGCSRCKREGIKCHYSPQKQMGRPRKRQHVEVVDEAEVEGEQDAVAVTLNSGGAPVIDFAAFGVDVSSPDFNFLDFLSPGMPDVSQPRTAPKGPTHKKHSEPMVWHQEFPQINFDVPPDPPKHHKPSEPMVWHQETGLLNFDLTATPHHFTLPQEQHQDQPSTSPTPIPGLMSMPSSNHDTPKAPSLSSTTGGTPPDTHSHPHPTFPASAPLNFPNKSCSCMASIYLALESLSHLPAQTGPAMGIARTATKAAHDTILCPTCSPQNVTDPAMVPPVQSFQVLMMLGALLPTLANVYQRILGMVDTEATSAEAEGRRLAFSLQEYGGLWGRLATADAACGASAASTLNGSLMEPATWRLTVRALLRIDVYGVNSDSNEAFSKVKSCSFIHIGLRDVVEALEMRSKIRHASMDHAVAHGLIDHGHAGAHGHVMLPPGEKHTCLRVIDIAKHAIEQLVIA